MNPSNPRPSTLLSGESPDTGLGDVISSALDKVGITKQRIEEWVGMPCGCQERQDKLNALGFWAKRVIMGRLSRATEHLENLIGEN